MKFFDLCHTIEPGMPVFPGTEAPVFTQGCSISQDGFAEKKIAFFSHTGTHIDSPAHILEGQPTLDQLTIDRFIGGAICINLDGKADRNISPQTIEPFLTQLQKIDFVLFASGWSKYWGDNQYFQDYPVLTPDAADLLCRYNLKGIGFDTISADRCNSNTLPIHRILLRKMIIIENLNNLTRIPTSQFLFSCLPLKIAEGDGSPVRAVAICDLTEGRET